MIAAAPAPIGQGVSTTAAKAAAPVDPWADQRRARVPDPDELYETADPISGAPLLKLISDSQVILEPEATSEIQVQAVPGAKVVMVATEGGLFPNGRASITVTADGQGLARTLYAPGPGVYDDASVRISSPQAVGTVHMVMHVLYSESPIIRAQSLPSNTK